MKAIAIVGVTVAIVSLPAQAAGSVLAGHAGWFWGNPVPQGNTLRAVTFAGNRGYAVGDFGTVMRSDDRGESWTGVTTATTASLHLVDAISPDTIVVGGGCVVQRSDDAGRSFTPLPWRPTGAGCPVRLRSLAFPSSEVGYLVLSDGTVVRTRDGGTTWVRRTAVPGTPATQRGTATHPTDVQFPTTDIGVVATEGGVLYRTTDGGVSWSPVAGSTQHLDSISFPDPLDGFAVGGASVLKTVDGGISWTQRGVVAAPESLASISCRDALRCVATTASGDELLLTDDGGSSWASISPSTLPLYASAYSASGSVVAVGEAGATVSSADGGFNFSPIGGELGGQFTGLRAASPEVAYAFGRAGALVRTVDGGQTWAALSAPGAGDLVDLAFPTIRTGYVLDRHGNLMRTSDGGHTWQMLDIGTYLVPRAVLALDAQRLVLVGPHGVRRSLNGGFAFNRVGQRLVRRLALTAGGVTNGMLYAYGPHALVVSTDSGDSWHSATLPSRGTKLVKVVFADKSIAYALTRDGRVWKSPDRGLSWNEIAAVGTKFGTDLAFSDPDSGYVAVSQFDEDPHGYVLRTSDGGRRWRPQLVDRAAVRAGAVAAPGRLIALAVTGADHVLATDSGGDVGQHSEIELSTRRLRLAKPGVIALHGALTPAHGGEAVVVSKRPAHERWFAHEVTVSSTGSFTVFSYVARTTRFVAQWSGDDTRAGAGSTLLTVTLPAKHPKENR
jgi:photosystem II stability/assembly factor-like uncharacterized protein